MSLEKIAVGYVRCSDDQQGDSPEQQKKAITAFAETRGFQISEWFIDFGKSGTTFDQRPEFQRLRRTIDGGASFGTVICYDESRWGRAIDSEENTYWRVYFRMHKVNVLLVKTSIDPGHEFAPMLKAFEGVQASQYSKKLSEVTLRGAKDNGIYSSGGTAPYGYKRIAVNLKTQDERDLADGDWSVRGQEKVRWEIGDQKEIDAVILIYQERLAGKACVLIAEALNRRGVPPPKRGKWKNKDRKWCSNTIRGILENPAYYGARVYNRNSMSKILAQQRGRDRKQGINYPHWRNSSEEWVVVEDAHPPIVNKELWTRVQAVVKQHQPSKNNQYTVRGTYLLTGLVRCSRCGFSFQGCSSTAKGRPYHRYVDSGWKAKRVCGFLSLSKEKLETYAIQVIKENLLQPGLSHRIEKALSALLENRPREHAKGLEGFQATIRVVEEKRLNLLNAIELNQAGSALPVLLQRLQSVEDEHTRLKREIESHERQVTNDVDVRQSAYLVTEFLKNFEDLFAGAPIEERKTLIRKCLSRVIVDRDMSVVRFGIWQIPAVIPQIEDLYKNRTALTTGVASAASSGDPK